jgi:hypothetical protein
MAKAKHRGELAVVTQWYQDAPQQTFDVRQPIRN